MRRTFFFFITYIITALVTLGCLSGRAQSIDKLKRQAMNTSQLTVTAGDSIVTFNLLASGERVPSANLDRRYWWYGASTLHSTQGGYSGRLLDGSYVLRNSEGDLLEQGQLSEGQRTGEWRSWHAGGTIKGVHHWRKGQLHGGFEEYSLGGELQREGRYREGSLRGRVKLYDAEGERTVIRYRDGEAVAPKEKKERKRFLKARRAWQKAKERAEKINFLQKKDNDTDSGTEVIPKEKRKQKRLERKEQQETSFLLPFRVKDKAKDAPQG